MGQQVARMAQDWQDMTSKIVQVFSQTVSSFNDDIAKAMTGQGKKGDFGHTFLQAGQGLISKLPRRARKGLSSAYVQLPPTKRGRNLFFACLRGSHGLALRRHRYDGLMPDALDFARFL